MVQSTSICSVMHEPEGLYISTKVKHLPTGEYAFVRGKKGKGTDVLKLTKSQGTDFYKYVCTIDILYDLIKATNFFPLYAVELNACPASSDTMEYAQDSLIFNI